MAFTEPSGKTASLQKDINKVAADTIYTQLKEQAAKGVSHQASFSKDQDAIIRDMANKFASYGIKSIYDLGQQITIEMVPDPNYFDDGQAPLVEQEVQTVFNKNTGEKIPVGPGGKLTNSGGSGFTWYKVQFTPEGIPVPFAEKEATGIGAVGDQIKSIISIPAVQAALTAFGAQYLGPTTTVTDAAGNVIGSYGSNLLSQSTANAVAAGVTGAAAKGDVLEGLKAGATSYLASEAVRQLTGGTNVDYDYDVEGQLGGFYGNTPNAVYDPKTGVTTFYTDGKVTGVSQYTPQEVFDAIKNNQNIKFDNVVFNPANNTYEIDNLDGTVTIIDNVTGEQLIFDDSTNTIIGRTGGVDTTVGGTNIDTVVGGTNIDTTVGGTNTDTVKGGGGTDTTKGGGGTDTTKGGGGTDTTKTSVLEDAWKKLQAGDLTKLSLSEAEALVKAGLLTATVLSSLFPGDQDTGIKTTTVDTGAINEARTGFNVDLGDGTKDPTKTETTTTLTGGDPYSRLGITSGLPAGPKPTTPTTPMQTAGIQALPVPKYAPPPLLGAQAPGASRTVAPVVTAAPTITQADLVAAAQNLAQQRGNIPPPSIGAPSSPFESGLAKSASTAMRIGGIVALKHGGALHYMGGGMTAPVNQPRMLAGGGDGMSDSIPATIDGTQPARLADGEFVVPADVVADLGNGSSRAGAKQLYEMMDRIRQARHGTTKQPPEVDVNKTLPV